MADGHSPVLVRMEDELKAALLRQSKLHGRTLTGEINSRLRDSLKQPEAPDALPAPYIASNLATVHLAKVNGPAPAANDLDRAMLDVFHKLPVEKQLALLSLFR